VAEDKRTGLLVLHGNRLELLAEAVFAWMAANPLGPLEPETVLVQSNGMAEWVKMELAAAHGVCAATRVELPARFIWQAYRAVLGPAAVPATSPLDKLPLTWRLMGLLPALAEQPVFEPVASFLSGGAARGDAGRRLQLAERLADLFDQYQVYRSDWLQDWARGDDVLRTGLQTNARKADPVPADQRWQPALWRALQPAPADAGAPPSRAALHQRFVEALRRAAPGDTPAFAGLPRRIVLFGTTHIPHQTLQAIAALAAHCQVLMAVPNPCRYHWADIIDGRELLRATRHRHALRHGRDLSKVPLQEMHAHGHPLLAAWGRQSRDFVRQLDAFDDAQAARRRFGLQRVDLFDDTPGSTLLQQVQAAICDLMPLAEHPHRGVPAEDRSIVFHVAHGAQREVEILHDQLLHLLAHPPGDQPLNPRDIVVMVPDIDAFAPAIRSVFGQHARRDPRHIPWGIADQKDRGQQPLLVALEWLLRAPQQRFGASEVRDLLGVPAVASRFAITPEELPTLAAWIEGAGVRWGLDAAQRDSLGLGACGDQNTWAFGLRRMLLGYATGELPGGQAFAGIQPHAEVAGLAAGLAGALAELLQTLGIWWADANRPQTPAGWAERLRRLLADVFKPTDESETGALAALGDALTQWLQACDTAGFDEPLDLAVVREAWLEAIDAPRTSHRFKAGGVTFCTLLPLRAIPFQVVCLLGMNEGDYPRRGSRSDFDLMAVPGQARPGDRSRRDDDRQLMLDALLSARRVLYVSWAGRSQRDNQEQPPSVLVSQLRDYLAAGWNAQVVAERTTEHPLQPFSRRYFEPGPDGLFTYAREWRAAHATPVAMACDASTAASRADTVADDEGMVFTVQALTAFLRNPVKEFFRHRLQVVFDEHDAADDDDEPFGSQGLDRWRLLDDVLHAARRQASVPGAVPQSTPGFLAGQIERLAREGRLPLAGPGQEVAAALLDTLSPMVAAWQEVLAKHPVQRNKLPLRLAHPRAEQLVFEDWLTGLHAADGSSAPVWIELQAARLASEGSARKPPEPRPNKLLAAWVRCLASAACGCPAEGIVIGEGALVHVKPPPEQEARDLLADLMLACHAGLRGDEPLPTAVKTGVAWLAGPEKARTAFEGAFGAMTPGEGAQPALVRLFANFDDLAAHPAFDAASRRLYERYTAWLQQQVHVEALVASAAREPAVD
jgi:exodeoxyribonuclease V gamma subunit